MSGDSTVLGFGLLGEFTLTDQLGNSFHHDVFAFPEPGTIALLTFGVMVLGVRRRIAR